MKNLLIAALAATPLLVGCAASGTREEIGARYDFATTTEFAWEPVAIPKIDVPAAAFVAYNSARQKVLVDMMNRLDFPVLDRFDSAVAAEIAAMAPEDADDEWEPTDEQRAAAVKTVKGQMTPEERAAMDQQTNGFAEFVKTFTAELAKAGVQAFRVEQMKELLEDKEALTEGLETMQAIKVASQLSSLSDQVDAAVEIEAILGYLENTDDLWKAAGSDF